MSTPKLKTDRLILRGIKSDDIFGFADIFSDDETMKLFGSTTISNDLDFSKTVTDIQKEREKNISFFWSIIPKSERDFAGFIRLKSYQSFYFDSSYSVLGDFKDSEEFKRDIDRNGWELDYALIKKFRNNGYMSEALNAVVDFIQVENLYPIYAKVNSLENEATVRVLKKNKFSELFPQINRQRKLGMIYKLE